MKKLLIIANWKSYKGEKEIEEWFGTIREYSNLFTDASSLSVVICPSFPYLALVKQQIERASLPFLVGAQTVSSFDEGKYTGEVSAKQLHELVSYVLIGHSERIEHFGETKEALAEKVRLANQYGVQTIYCAPSNEVTVPEAVNVIAYEPPTSISPGPADTPENAAHIASQLQTTHPKSDIIYGGSVTPDNVHDFTCLPEISGVLVGRASLDAKEFGTLITNA